MFNKIASFSALALFATSAVTSPLCTPRSDVPYTLTVVTDNEVLDGLPVTVKSGHIGILQINPETLFNATSNEDVHRAVISDTDSPIFVQILGSGPGYWGPELLTAPKASAPDHGASYTITTNCDIKGNFYFTENWELNWKACTRREGQGYSINKVGPASADCVPIQLMKTYADSK